MNSDEQNLNVNLGLDRNTSAADRDRYIDHQRAQSMGSGGGSWSPPGGFGILWGLIRGASRNRRSQRESSPRVAAGNGRLSVVVCGIIGAVVASKTGNPWLVGALVGAGVGAFARQIVTLIKWGVALAVIAVFVGAYNNRQQLETSDARLYQDAADRFVQEYEASQGLPPPDQTYASFDSVPPAPPGWRLEDVEMVMGEANDGTPCAEWKPIYVKDE